MIKGYLATHFFNEAGLLWTNHLAASIRNEVEIDLYVPQENGEINDKSGDDSHITAEAIAEGDNKYLKEADILIANLDGVEIDSGVSAEIGYFSGLIEAELNHVAMPKPRFIVGIYTDMRQDGTGDNHYYINLYTKGLVEHNGYVVRSTAEAIEVLKTISNRLKIYNQMGEKI